MLGDPTEPMSDHDVYAEDEGNPIALERALTEAEEKVRKLRDAAMHAWECCGVSHDDTRGYFYVVGLTADSPERFKRLKDVIEETAEKGGTPDGSLVALEDSMPVDEYRAYERGKREALAWAAEFADAFPVAIQRRPELIEGIRRGPQTEGGGERIKLSLASKLEKDGYERGRSETIAWAVEQANKVRTAKVEAQDFDGAMLARELAEIIRRGPEGD